MSRGKKLKKDDRLYTLHGVKKAQGLKSIINGHLALAYFEGDKVVGYTTLEEMNKAFYTDKDLPEYTVNF